MNNSTMNSQKQATVTQLADEAMRMIVSQITCNRITGSGTLSLQIALAAADPGPYRRMLRIPRTAAITIVTAAKTPQPIARPKVSEFCDAFN